MRKGLFAVCVVSLFMLWAAGPVKAQSPHWNSATVTLNTTDGTLDFAWKVSGLGGPGVSVTFDAGASQVLATYACINHGNNVVQGNPFQVTAQSVVVPVTLTSKHNGTISGSAILEPPAAPDGSCKGKFFPKLLSVTWYNATLSAGFGLGEAPLTGTADCLTGTGCTATF
jgi:hypothetical protein